MHKVRGARLAAPLVAALVLGTTVVWATTYHTITVDGTTSEWAADEKTPADSASDSLYGSNNELSSLYVTWDAQKLYLAFDYKAWNTGVMVLVESGSSGGAQNLCKPGYGGAYPANLKGPGFDLMVAFFAPASASKPAVSVHTLSASGSTDVTLKTGVQSTINDTANTTTFVHSGSVEAAIPWNTIYGLGAGTVPKGATLKLVGVIRGGKDNDGLGDVNPDPAGAVIKDACGGTKVTTLDAFHTVTVDSNGDGTPDVGWSPGGNSAAPDAGVPDATPVPDSAPPKDTAVAADTTVDSTAVVDTAVAADQQLTDSIAPQVDTGPAADTGALADASSATDGSSAADAFVDAGGGGANQEEGCACSAKASPAASSSSLLALALLALVVLDRRRRS